MKFLAVVAEKILIQNILTQYGSWLNILCYAWCNTDLMICQGYKPASLNWCCKLLLCFDGEKSGSLMKNWWSFTVAATKKRAKQSYLRVCGDIWTFRCLSKTVHQHTELAKWLHFWIGACRLISCPHVAQCWHDKHFSLANQIKFTIKGG